MVLPVVLVGFSHFVSALTRMLYCFDADHGKLCCIFILILIISLEVMTLWFGWVWSWPRIRGFSSSPLRWLCKSWDMHRLQQLSAACHVHRVLLYDRDQLSRLHVSCHMVHMYIHAARAESGPRSAGRRVDFGFETAWPWRLGLSG